LSCVDGFIHKANCCHINATQTLQQLEESISTLLQELLAKKLTSPRKKFEKEKQKDNSKDAVFGIFKKRAFIPNRRCALLDSA
jgi:methionyl-tRNA formyltransferase